MAKQIGLMKLHGTMDDVNFYETKRHGKIARRKPGPTGKQVKKGKNYENLRRHQTEWGRASHYSAVIRLGIKSIITHCKNGETCNNLNKRLFEIIEMDKQGKWGERDLRIDTITALRHFELNSDSLSSKYFEPPIDTVADKGCIDISAGICFKRKVMGADAWKVKSTASSIDLRTDAIVNDERESDLYELEKGNFDVSFRHYAEEGSNVFHGMCIVFYKYDAVIDEYREIKEENVNAGFLRFVQTVERRAE